MADIVVDKKAKSLDISDRLEGYSRVVIYTGQTDADGNDIAYVAGNETGRTLEVDNPWGNQTVADNILAKIQGWAYQPMDASSVKLPPAFELGDSVVVNNVFSGVYDSRLRFSSVFAGDIKAPLDKEIDHEYQFEDSKERKYNRKLDAAVARLNFFADSIEAKVDKISEGASFGWRLTEDGWSVFNQVGNIFTVDASGASVTGEIKATTGTIGGFTIGARGIYFNQTSIDGQEGTGVYIGTDGIKLGNSFRVNADGSFTATNGYFSGDVYAKNIRSGGDYGYLSGGAISPYSLDFSQLTSGVNGVLGYASAYNLATQKGSGQYPTYFCADTVSANTGMLSPEYWLYDKATNAAFSMKSLKGHTHYITVSGNTVTLGAPDYSGEEHSFSVAPSIGSVSISLDGANAITYQNSMDRFAVSVRATDGSGNVIGRGTVYVRAAVSIGFDETYYEPGWRTYYHVWAKLNGNENWGASFDAYANTTPELIEV